MYIQLIKEQIYFNTNILFMYLLNYSKNNVYLNIYIYTYSGLMNYKKYFNKVKKNKQCLK